MNPLRQIGGHMVHHSLDVSKYAREPPAAGVQTRMVEKPCRKFSPNNPYDQNAVNTSLVDF